MKEKIKENKGFIQIVLLIITQLLIVGLLITAAVIAISVYREGNMGSIVDSVGDAFRR